MGILDEVARVCLTHLFNNHKVDEYIGKFDVSKEELTLIKDELDKVIFDEYDKLIQLCDCLAGTNGVLDIEMRMNDVKRRYGFYPQQKWDSNITFNTGDEVIITILDRINVTRKETRAEKRRRIVDLGKYVMPSGRSVEEIDDYIRGLRDNDRF